MTQTELRPGQRCPTCGRRVPQRPAGRPAMPLPVREVLDALAGGARVTDAARRFGVSRATIYRVMHGEAGRG